VTAAEVNAAAALAARAAWFHEPRTTGAVTARAREDPHAWAEYAAWHQAATSLFAATPATMSTSQCQTAIRQRLAVSGPLTPAGARTRLAALGFEVPAARLLLAGARRHHGMPARARGGGLTVEVTWQDGQYHVNTLMDLTGEGRMAVLLGPEFLEDPAGPDNEGTEQLT
jgi:hypothetical protein